MSYFITHNVSFGWRWMNYNKITYLKHSHRFPSQGWGNQNISLLQPKYTFKQIHVMTVDIHRYDSFLCEAKNSQDWFVFYHTLPIPVRHTE